MSVARSRHPRQSWSVADVDHSPTLPEERLWRAVIDLAFRDAVEGPRVWHSARTREQFEALSGRAQEDAQRWLLSGSRDFVMVCDLAGRDPVEVKEKAERLLSDPEAMRRFIEAGKVTARGRRATGRKSRQRLKPKPRRKDQMHRRKGAN